VRKNGTVRTEEVPLANATATISVTSSDTGCGCCTSDPKTTDNVIRELESRRDSLDARLARLGSR
jgi:hypothetical protein